VASSLSSQRQAETHDRDVTRITNAGIRPLGTVGIRVRAAVIRAIRQGGDVGKAIRDAIKPIQVPLQQSMTASFILGQYRAKSLVQPVALARKVTDPLGIWRNIVDFAVDRVGITNAEIDTIGKRFAAQSVAAMDSMGGLLEDKIRKAIAESVRTGEHVDGTIAAVRKAFDDAGMTNAKPFLIETQARTQTQLAYSAGRLKANEDHAIQDILWGYEYVTVGDDRVRPGHAALDGLKLPKDDPRWQEIMPPNGWNCRCSVIEVFKDESIATSNDIPEFVEVDGEVVRAGADEGFDFNPLDIFNAQQVVLR